LAYSYKTRILCAQRLPPVERMEFFQIVDAFGSLHSIQP
jgi:hypothetical protein